MFNLRYFQKEMEKQHLKEDRLEAQNDSNQQTNPSLLYKIYSFFMPTDPQKTPQEKQSEQIRMISKT